jgi:hypothetical protein
MKTAADRRPPTTQDLATLTAPPRSTPVKAWALVGALMLAMVLTGWLRWITSPDFTPSPKGPDPLADSSRVVLFVIQVASLGAALAFVWRLLIRPAIRERRLTFDGMLLIGAATLWFYDPLDNYINFTFTYNAHLLNLASWTRFIPGWESPNAHLFPEPIAMIGGMYVWFICAAAMIGCWVIRMLRARRPTLTMPQLVAAVFVTFAVLDAIVEILFIRGEIFAYPGTVHSFTLWAGSRYQFPLYEPFCIGLWCGGIALLRYYRDDKGRSLVERGVDTLRVPARARTALSFLAVLGFLHVWFIIGYFFPYNAFAVKADTWPAMPSYMRVGICGEGTDYACPSRLVPIPSRTSLHVTPDDPRLPATVRARQGQ